MSDTQKMIDSIRAMADNLGPEFRAAFENSITDHHPEYKKGKKMTVAEARNLKPGDIAWMTFKKSAAEGFRINEAVEFMGFDETNKDCLLFDCCDFDIDSQQAPDDHASNWDYAGQYLYHVVAKK